MNQLLLELARGFEYAYIQVGPRNGDTMPTLVRIPVCVECWTVRQALARSPAFKALRVSNFDILCHGKSVPLLTPMRDALADNSPSFPLQLRFK